MKDTRMVKRAFATALCASALVIASQAQAAQDEGFMKKAAEGNQFEIQLAPIAQENAGSDQVKQMAQKIADDHRKANEKLEKIAASQNVALPTKAVKESEIKKLSKLKGAAFDREYVKAMVRDHKHDIKEFQKEASKGKNPQVKQFASNALPTLREHLQLAERTRTNLNQATGSSTSGGAGKSK